MFRCINPLILFLFCLTLSLPSYFALLNVHFTLAPLTLCLRSLASSQSCPTHTQRRRGSRADAEVQAVSVESYAPGKDRFSRTAARSLPSNNTASSRLKDMFLGNR